VAIMPPYWNVGEQNEFIREASYFSERM